jgi:hypothetical protein
MDEYAFFAPSPVQAYPQAPEVQGEFQSLVAVAVAVAAAMTDANTTASVNIVLQSV